MKKTVKQKKEETQNEEKTTDYEKLYNEELQKNKKIQDELEQEKAKSLQEIEKKLKKRQRPIDTNLYDVVVYDILDDKIVQGTVYTAREKREGRTKYLFNLDPKSDTFTKIAFPRVKSLKYEDQYKTYEEVSLRIIEIKNLLELNDPTKYGDDVNEIDLEEELLDLILLAQKI